MFFFVLKKLLKIKKANKLKQIYDTIKYLIPTEFVTLKIVTIINITELIESNKSCLFFLD